MFLNIPWGSIVLCFHTVPEGSITFRTVPGKSITVLNNSGSACCSPDHSGSCLDLECSVKFQDIPWWVSEGARGSAWVHVGPCMVHSCVCVCTCGCVWVHVWSGVVMYVTVMGLCGLVWLAYCRIYDYNFDLVLVMLIYIERVKV